MGFRDKVIAFRNKHVLAFLSKQYCRKCGAYKMSERRIRRECPKCGDPEDKNFIHYLKELFSI